MTDKLKKGIEENTELEKSKAHIVVEIIEYMANAVVIKTIIKKLTGNVSIMSFDSGEGLVNLVNLKFKAQRSQCFRSEIPRSSRHHFRL